MAELPLDTSLAKRRKLEGTFCCGVHESLQLAVVFCSDCPGPLCEECHGGHKSVGVLKKHKIKSLDIGLKEGIASSTNLPLCPTHNKELQYYCQDCEDVVCVACPVVGPHQSHRVPAVDKEVGELNKPPLVQCIKSVEKRMDKMSSAVRDIDNRLFTLHEESNHCKEDITEMKECIFEAVTNRCAVLVAEVEEVEERRRRDLEEHKKTLQDQMKQLAHIKTPAEDIVHDSTTREQLSECKAIIQRAFTLTSTPIPPPPPSSSSIHFVSEKREEAEKILSQVGRLSLGADPGTSAVEGLTIDNNTVECRPWTNVPLMLKVVTRDHSGSQCAFGGENVASVLTPTTCGVPVLGKVEDIGDGTYRVIFVSVPSEECALFVTVNGVHIRDSPLNVKMCYASTIKQEIRDHKVRSFGALVYSKQGTLLATNDDNEVCTFAQNGEMLNSFKIQNPEGYVGGIASLSNGNIAVSLCNRKCIAVYTPNGELVKEFGSDRLKEPGGLAVNNNGQLFVAEDYGNRISVYSENGEFQYSFGFRRSQPGDYDCPELIFMSSQDGLLYVTHCNNNRVQVFQQDGRFVQQFGEDVLSTPAGIALTKDGHIVVASESADKLSIFSPSGECVHEVEDVGLKNPLGVAVTDDGFIFVADHGGDKIVKL